MLPDGMEEFWRESILDNWKNKLFENFKDMCTLKKKFFKTRK